MIGDLKMRLLTTLPRDLLLDLFDMVAARALQASDMVRERAGLDEKRARELIGQARFRMQEQGFVETCQLHGGQLLPDGMIPGTSTRAFQPFVRFGGDGPGVVLGLATMGVARDLPHKNRSRLAGVVLNFQFTNRLDLGEPEPHPRPGDIFVLFLVARDRTSPGLIDEVAVGLIDDEYKTYVFYESVDQFLAGYGPQGGTTPPQDPETSAPKLVKLKGKRKPFTPPEQAGDRPSDRKDEA